jgi:hypothetical protein
MKIYQLKALMKWCYHLLCTHTISGHINNIILTFHFHYENVVRFNEAFPKISEILYVKFWKISCLDHEWAGKILFFVSTSHAQE